MRTITLIKLSKVPLATAMYLLYLKNPKTELCFIATSQLPHSNVHYTHPFEYTVNKKKKWKEILSSMKRENYSIHVDHAKSGFRYIIAHHVHQHQLCWE